MDRKRGNDVILHQTPAWRLRPGYRLQDADYVTRLTLAPSMTRWVVDVERRTTEVGARPHRYVDAQITFALNSVVWAQHGDDRDPVDEAPVEGRSSRSVAAGVQTAIDVVERLSQSGLLGHDQ